MESSAIYALLVQLLPTRLAPPPSNSPFATFFPHFQYTVSELMHSLETGNKAIFDSLREFTAAFARTTAALKVGEGGMEGGGVSWGG